MILLTLLSRNAATAAATAISTSVAASLAASTASAVAATAATAIAGGVGAIVAGAVGAGAVIGASVVDVVSGATTNNNVSFDISHVHDYNGEYKIEYWNYKEEITTVFNPTDLTCEKCTVSTHCAKTKAPMSGDQYCETWEKESKKDCVTIQF